MYKKDIDLLKKQLKANAITVELARFYLNEKIDSYTRSIEMRRDELKNEATRFKASQKVKELIDGVVAFKSELALIDKAIEDIEVVNTKREESKDMDIKQMLANIGGIESPHKVFKEYKKWKPYRKLYACEENVNFKKFNEFYDKKGQEYGEESKEQLDTMISGMMAKADRSLKKKKMTDIAKISMVGIVAYKSLLKDTYNESYDFGKLQASDEIGMDAPKSNKKSQNNLTVDALVDRQMSDIELVTKMAILDGINRGLSDKDILFNSKIAAIKKAETLNRGNMNISIIGQITQGRQDVFLKSKDIQKFQYSAILDNRTTNWCSSLDGRVVEYDSPEFESYRPGQHFGCRSMWIAIMNDEKFPPKAEAISPKIPSQSGGVTGFKDLSYTKEYVQKPEVIITNEEKGDDLIESLKKMLHE